MAQKMREGRLDPAVAGWARGVLKDAGFDGRDGFPIRRQGAALLAALRAQAIYTPDAYGAEVISSAAATLCLRPGLCINGGDCDDLTVALGSALLSLGIPVAIVKQNFGGENQEHVLLVFQDESGDWVYADPSTNAPLGQAPKAVSEIWVDPMQAIGNLPDVTPQIVTFGRPPPSTGLAATTPNPPAPTSNWQLVTNGQLLDASRYRLGVLINVINWSTRAVASLTPASVAQMFATRYGLKVESAVATGDVTGGLQSWVVQGVAQKNITLTNDQDVQFVAVAVEVPETAPVLPTTTPPEVTQTPPSNVSVGQIVAVAGGVAVVGGVTWYLLTRKPRRRR